jgi:superfamily II DNA or RNA helicase
MLTTAAQQHRDIEARVAEIIAAPTHQATFPVELMKTPRDYQITAYQLLRTKRRFLLGDEVGLGKTLTGLLAAIDEDARPILVVAPTHLPRRWVTELGESLPMLTFEVAKKTTPPAHITAGHLPDVIVVSYSKLHGWQDALAGRVKTVLFDEVQDLRTGRDTNKGAAAAHVAGKAKYVMGLTATPVYNYGGELHNIFQILAPDALGTREEFIREWGYSTYNGHVFVQDPAALGKYLRGEGLMLARTRKEVGRELPAVTKVPHTVESDPEALRAIEGDAARLAEMILARGTARDKRFQAAGELDWKLRQATGIAKAPYVAEFVKMLLESEKKVALFGWHRAVWDIWRARLAEFRPVMYTGSESPTQKAAAEDAFIHGNARVLLMSLRSGAGVDGLQKVCSVPVFGELDWSPQVHEQAIGRFNRDGMDEDSPVIAYFLTSDEVALL